MKPGRHGAKRDILIIALIATAVRAPFLPALGYVGDQELFILWGNLAAAKGMASVYEINPHSARGQRFSNYPPGFLYVLNGTARVYAVITGGPIDEETGRAISNGLDTPATRACYALFKLPAALADIATAVLLCVFLRRRLSGRLPLAVGVLYAVHPAVLHDSVIWGQVDAIHTLLLLVSLEAAVRRRPFVMTVFATLAVLFKAQSMMLAPIWLMALVESRDPDAGGLVLSRIDFRATLKRVAYCVSIAVVLFAAAVLPFGRNMSGVWDAYFRAVGFYPFVHVNGFSLWFLVNPIVSTPLNFGPYRPDNVPVLFGLTPKAIGMIGFVLVWAVYLLLCRRRGSREDAIKWGVRILSLAFFLLPTQMHERYLFPLIALWAWTLGRDRAGWIGWIVVGACCWVNLAWVFPGMPGGEMERWFGAPFHSEGVGKAIGICCALALFALWVFELWCGVRPRLAAGRVSG